MVWEKNAAAGKAWNYTYDNGGNILSRTEYTYSTNGTVSGSGTTTSYTYGDAEWGDLLTAYDGEEITYDGIGNPLSSRGWTMSWQGGRQLSSMTKGSDTLSFAYNESGLRTSKTVNGVTHNYVWQGSKLAADITDAYALYFHYDSSGDVIGFTRTANGADTEYFYVKNLQGDILKVITSTGTEAATYTYDAWGKLLTSTGDMAEINPLRYRGYYYDAETSLYYLQSRYYDPEVCRFINTDSFATTDIDGVLSANMFAYCENNPVINEDPTGAIALTTLILIGSAVFGVATALYTGYEMRQAGYGWDDTIFYSLGAGICAFGTVYTLGSSLYSLYCSMSWYYGYAPITEIGTKNNSIPQEAYDTYEYVTSHNGTPKNGYKGGSTYANDGRAGSAVLPEEYAPFREYDIYPKIKNVSRGTERIVISDTGSSAWYTSDHYKTFVRLLTK